ncbi:MAG TPA: Rne/Rng family ribonuclease [Phycisphaerales bacterium]|nr:Rne/Rng family ribonuclease [Phycisphaerales bacterium]HMP38002.1 Rne/Rng family ribonuclease [Phycisphaerales bacterium]
MLEAAESADDAADWIDADDEGRAERGPDEAGRDPAPQRRGEVGDARSGRREHPEARRDGDREGRRESAPPRQVGGQVMIVNDTPGEECRIAIMSGHARSTRLESIFAERASTTTQVGNIYKGRVSNVEPAIQAAFVDFGHGQAGFLHISDLHPRYFPKGDGTERVGKKIPRRERPLIQDALRRGDEVLVQVLKQGIGTKGPTLTSYLSIPGRLIVMMPWMDKSGVSRKVEDEEQRREMRRILDSLDLPEGFGFILRTAGFDRTKEELQRDAAYLLRLWEVMEKRMHAVGAPCELYTESDLLIRTIRDVVDSSIETIVVDSASAFRRATMFLSVVAPRSAPRVVFYDRDVPIFHAFDVERQIELTHAQVVPLPSGGALVIDQTEALVAIDVNSGRSRAARDSETNAYHTNIEAVEEIARQLRLRDLGGVIINDLIDMRAAKHRRDIEDRFRQALRVDRAKTTVAPISEFGILEMTRQRMRPSLRKTHYIDCPHCGGHGEIKMPDAVAGDSLRRIACLLHYERVRRVEMVCSTRVASILLSTRRRAIDELEDRSGKKVEIRISDALAVDRIDLYAYDDRGADIDIEKLPAVMPPRLAELPTELPPEDSEADEPEARGGRRRRRRKPAPADATAIALAGGFEHFAFGGARPKPAAAVQEPRSADGAKPPQGAPGGRPPVAAGAPPAARAAGAAGAAPNGAATTGGTVEGDGQGEGGGRRRRRRRRRRGGGGVGAEMATDNGAAATGSERGQASAAPRGQALNAPTGSVGASNDGAAPSSRQSAAAVPPPAVEEHPRRVFELAKDLGVTSKELLARCAESEAIDVKNHMAVLSPDECAVVRAWFAPEPSVEAPDLDGAAAAESGRDDDESDRLDEPDAEGLASESSGDGAAEGGGGRRRRRRRRRGKGGGGDSGERGEGLRDRDVAAASPARGAPSPSAERAGGAAHSGGDSSPHHRGAQGAAPEGAASASRGAGRDDPARQAGAVSPAPAAPAFRPLYGAGRSKKVSPALKAAAARREGSP